MPIPSRWRLLDHDTDTVVAECDDIDGLFTDRVFPVPPVYERYTLLGCTPEGPLRAAVDGTGPAWLGNIYLEGVHAPCSATADCLTCYETGEQLLDVRVVGHTEAAGGLLDVELDARIGAPLAANERPLYDMWRAGGPTAPNQWAGLERSDRYLWVQAARAHQVHAPDKPAGTVYHLDGRHVTDYDAFYCAIGEAINGPGGWFGGDLFWLHECAGTGDAGATPGFRLIWHDAEIARTHLVPGYDRKAWSVAVTFDDLVDRLTDDGVQVELR
ncbi:barstar family protein [Dactylosporangium maewongense]|uniref:Barstar family protein n=1 Tax=Dactylosporangium maewongense TaxID=634393 RepID=A0ABP4LX53_9ACTN